MLRRSFLTLAAGLVAITIAWPAAAGEKLSASDIRSLLAGNTIDGTWAGSDYKQYFDPSGETTYLPAGGEPAPGKWRVDENADQYESWWPQTGWTSYDLEKGDGVYYWVDGKDERHPFEVLDGDRL